MPVTLAAEIEADIIGRATSSSRQANAQQSVSVSIRGITKSFAVRRGVYEMIRHPIRPETILVLDNIELDIRNAEMFGILGLNGAGKTTLLKILSTLILPDGGTASITGFDILENPRAVRDHLAIVTADERSLNWRLSAWDNMMLFAGLHRMSTADAKRRTGEALRSVDLENTGTKMVGSFSSGMRQRLLLARALLSNPRILLLDEPTRSLDPVAAHEFRGLLRDLADRRGATIILATHNPEEAFAYCDRVAVLHQGTIAALGRARDLATRYGQERFRICTPSPEHFAFNALSLRGLIADLVRHEDVDTGSSVECTINGGDTQAAEVLQRLVESHVVVTRFERVSLPLSALIARIVESRAASHPGKSTNA
jgi:ABC-2 type transport system ATP-binding protein